MCAPVPSLISKATGISVFHLYVSSHRSDRSSRQVLTGEPPRLTGGDRAARTCKKQEVTLSRNEAGRTGGWGGGGIVSADGWRRDRGKDITGIETEAEAFVSCFSYLFRFLLLFVPFFFIIFLLSFFLSLSVSQSVSLSRIHTHTHTYTHISISSREH